LFFTVISATPIRTLKTTMAGIAAFASEAKGFDGMNSFR
jgi:hypothetical protein